MGSASRLGLRRGQSLTEDSFPALVRSSPDLLGFQLYTWHLSYKVESRGQGQLGMAAKRGGRPCSGRAGAEEGEGNGRRG